MAAPLAKTFQTLSTTDNPVAGDLLIAALDVPIPSIQCEAVRSLIGRGGIGELTEAIRHSPSLPDEIRLELAVGTASLIPGVGEGSVNGSHLELLPALIEMLQDKDAWIRRSAVDVLAHVKTTQVLTALLDVKDDPSEHVRQAVEQALLKISARESEDSGAPIPSNS